MKFIVAAFLLLLVCARVCAAPRDPKFQRRPAPANVLSQLQAGAHSVLFQQVDVGAGEPELFCHLYTRGATYFLDLLRPAGADALRPFRSIDLGNTPHSMALEIRFLWLQPKHRCGPILQLYDRDLPGEWDGSYDLIVLPDGWQGRDVQQQFLEKYIGGTAINPSFDSYDARGLLIVHLWEVYEAQLQSHVQLFWNGRNFVERPPRFAVIGPLPDYARAKEFVQSPAVRGAKYVFSKPLLHPSRNYAQKGVAPGRVVVVLNALSSQSEAEAVAAGVRKQGIACSVLRLY